MVAKIYKDNSYTNGMFKNEDESNKFSNETYRKLKNYVIPNCHPCSWKRRKFYMCTYLHELLG